MKGPPCAGHKPDSKFRVRSVLCPTLPGGGQQTLSRESEKDPEAGPLPRPGLLQRCSRFLPASEEMGSHRTAGCAPSHCHGHWLTAAQRSGRPASPQELEAETQRF